MFEGDNLPTQEGETSPNAFFLFPDSLSNNLV